MTQIRASQISCATAIKTKADPGISNSDLKDILAYDANYIQQEIDNLEENIKRMNEHLGFLKFYQERLINDLQITIKRL